MSRVVLMLLILTTPSMVAAQRLEPPVLLGTNASSSPACSDGLDNDGDGVADYPGDMGCGSPYDSDESGDNLVIIYGNGITGTQLNNCINGADQAGLCNNVANAKAANTTVCGNATSTNTCNSPTLRTISGDFTTTYANTSYNYVRFGNTGNWTVANMRAVNSEFHLSGHWPSGMGFPNTASGFVIDHSVVDGGQNSSLPGYCYEFQMGINAANGRITNNLIENICPYTNAAGQDHAEAFYIENGADNLFMAGNTFENNGGTAHIFFTDGGSADNFPTNVCVKSNNFGRKWGGTVYDISVRMGSSSKPTSIYIESTNVLRPTNQRYPGVASAQFIGGDSYRSCTQCNDGIDNDGDGKADYWPDGSGDSGCSSAGDSSE